jgi:hypothetical protein
MKNSRYAKLLGGFSKFTDFTLERITCFPYKQQSSTPLRLVLGWGGAVVIGEVVARNHFNVLINKFDLGREERGG